MEDPEWRSRISVSDAIELRESPLGGLGFFARRDIGEDEIVVKIPKSSVLSPKSIDKADLFQKFEHLSSSDLLTVAYLLEKSRGEKSKWSYFISSVEKAPLPDVPALWNATELSWLQGTNINVWAVAGLEDIKESFSQCRKLLSSLKDELSVTFEIFRDAMLVTSSRAFDVDNYHDLAFVPGACFFNHSDRESLHFETDGTVCGACGRQICDCSSDEWEDAEIDSEEDGFSDEQSSGIEESEKSKPNRDGSTDMDKPSVVKRSAEEDDNVCEMRIIRSVGTGDEVFNTYGEDPNCVLLSRYGFCIWNNANEVVDFSDEIEEYAAALKKQKALARWREKQEGKIDEDGNDELAFVGIINGPNHPRLSEGLQSLASKLKADKMDLTRILAQQRYKKYKLEDTSSQLEKQLEDEHDYRKRAAMTAVGSEKKLLEYYLF